MSTVADLATAYPEEYSYGQRVANELIDFDPAGVSARIVLARMQLDADPSKYRNQHSLGDRELSKTRGFLDCLQEYVDSRGD